MWQCLCADYRRVEKEGLAGAPLVQKLCVLVRGIGLGVHMLRG